MTLKNIDTNNDLLKEIYSVRRKCKKDSSKENKSQYDKLVSQCMKKYDYLVEIKARRYKEFANYDDLKQFKQNLKKIYN